MLLPMERTSISPRILAFSLNSFFKVCLKMSNSCKFCRWQIRVQLASKIPLVSSSILKIIFPDKFITNSWLSYLIRIKLLIVSICYVGWHNMINLTALFFFLTKMLEFWLGSLKRKKLLDMRRRASIPSGTLSSLCINN